MKINDTLINKRQITVHLDEEELFKIILDAVAKEANIQEKGYAAKVSISSKSSDTRGSIPYADVSIDINMEVK